MPRLPTSPAVRPLTTVLLSAVLVVLAPAAARAKGEPGPLTRTATSVLGLAPFGTTGEVVGVGTIGSSTVLLQRFLAAGGTRQRVSAGRGIGRAVVVQPDGRVVVVGSRPPAPGSSEVTNGFVTRLRADGKPDPSFPTTLLRNIVPNAVALGPKGTIVTAGRVPGGDGFPRISLTRLTSSGALDPSFGRQGSRTVDLGSGSEARAVVVQGDGRIVVAGQQRPGLQVTNALIARVRSDGSLDRTFHDGKPYFYYHPEGGANSSLNALALDDHGGFVAAGIDVRDQGNFALFVRLNEAGRLEQSFGKDGVQTTPASRNYDAGEQIGPRAIALAGSGRIAVAGAFQDSGLRRPALWVLTATGRLDPSVGEEGRVLTRPGGDEGGGEALGLTVTPDGTLVTGGVATNPPRAQTGYVQRFTGFGPPPVVASGGTGSGGSGAATQKFRRVSLSPRTLGRSTRATLAFSLTSPGGLSIRVYQRRAGRTSGSRCVRTREAVAPERRCGVFVVLPNRRLLNVKSGANRVRVTRTFEGRTLESGSYRLRLHATGGAERYVGFRVRTR